MAVRTSLISERVVAIWKSFMTPAAKMTNDTMLIMLLRPPIKSIVQFSCWAEIGGVAR